ncbi:hypothetical protein [Flavobacterium ginsengisoli]|uniref:beta-xylosidase family glycoside hydrolase n=1 Tax=Flavobacterium ginsengisoli TaxID=871694 RepID=UPI0024156305|nr:hypothetical protein [Flavobacterium ginsengisoli]
MVWQWNHNPDNSNWSVKERKGYLRLRTSKIDSSFTQVKNILTQRTFGPVCSGSTMIEFSNMKEGDFAGLSLLQKDFGLVGVKVENGKKKVVMINAENGNPKEIESALLNQDRVFFKAECNFKNQADQGKFYYSLDGKKWISIGKTIKMPYTLPHFMGYRFGLFNYASKTAGGFADFDYFRVEDTISEMK